MSITSCLTLSLNNTTREEGDILFPLTHTYIRGQTDREKATASYRDNNNHL